MGIIENGINGPFKGKAGSVIGSSWKKINYIKGLPRKRERIPSEEQAVQRLKFELLNNFLIPLNQVLNIGFHQFTDKATGANAAFSHNYAHAFATHGDLITLKYSALQLSHGSLYPAGMEKAWLEIGGVRVTWNPKTYGMGGEVDDVAYAIAHLPSKRLFFRNEDSAVRNDGTTFVSFLGTPIDKETHVWLFFADRQRKRVSRTVYIPLSPSNS